MYNLGSFYDILTVLPYIVAAVVAILGMLFFCAFFWGNPAEDDPDTEAIWREFNQNRKK